MLSASTDPIAAIAIAPGKGGIGIVRLSGRDLRPLVMGLLGRIPPPRRAIHSRFLDSCQKGIDDGLAIFFSGPESYTGEDVLELHGHGGPVVMQMLLRRCLELGARPARPGEFTERAYLNDKLDLAQAEAVADLIDAATTVSARCAMRSLSGDFSRVINSLVAELVDLRVLVEAMLDFPEEEIDHADHADARERLERLKAEVDRALEKSRRGSVLRTGLLVVIAGRPNMGKSSLLNALSGDDVAIVTSIPGTTRDAIRQTVQVSGVPINIVDTAGLRDTADEVEVLGIRKTWEMLERADAAILVVEANTGMVAEDSAILEQLPKTLPRIIVENKLDLTDRAPRLAKDGNAVIVSLSAATGEGLDFLRKALLDVAGWQVEDEDVFMARARHLDALIRASHYLSNASAVLMNWELLAEELRLVQRELGSITGETVADDLLGEIFSRFCIGT